MAISESESKAVSFPLGRIVMTAGAVERLSFSSIATALLRHARADWGDVNDASRRENERGLKYGMSLLSVYRDWHGIAFWVMTEADRSATTVLLPDDY
jgi:hypothetical protein